MKAHSMRITKNEYDARIIIKFYHIFLVEAELNLHIVVIHRMISFPELKTIKFVSLKLTWFRSLPQQPRHHSLLCPGRGHPRHHSNLCPGQGPPRHHSSLRPGRGQPHPRPLQPPQRTRSASPPLQPPLRTRSASPPLQPPHRTKSASPPLWTPPRTRSASPPDVHRPSLPCPRPRPGREQPLRYGLPRTRT